MVTGREYEIYPTDIEKSVYNFQKKKNMYLI